MKQAEIEDTSYPFCPYFSLKVTVKLTRGAREDFVTFSEVSMHLSIPPPSLGREISAARGILSNKTLLQVSFLWVHRPLGAKSDTIGQGLTW